MAREKALSLLTFLLLITLVCSPAPFNARPTKGPNFGRLLHAHDAPKDDCPPGTCLQCNFKECYCGICCC
ncbi:hypothetical protein GOP47_0008388 [Adiantum capillus-veneris]|uniref:Uncharacterized protein n=1 Tax=Adiantum capillus-veneris TaxID=13818 RepID=A0A9D4UZ82_ADICA|nr:hypothetical protein GOP47_0008388 [Adiantum capillus-veneris]